MTDNELLLAISNIMEDKLQSGLRPIRSDLEEVKADQKKMGSDLEEVKADQKKMRSDLEEVKADQKKMRSDLEEVKADQKKMRSDLEEVKADQEKMRSDLEAVKEDQEKLKQRVVNMALILENETNHNIQLLAENHINLVDKLNQAIRVGDKNMLLEIQISGQKMRIDKLEEEVARIKENIA